MFILKTKWQMTLKWPWLWPCVSSTIQLTLWRVMKLKIVKRNLQFCSTLQCHSREVSNKDKFNCKKCLVYWTFRPKDILIHLFNLSEIRPIVQWSQCNTFYFCTFYCGRWRQSIGRFKDTFPKTGERNA